MAKKRLYYSFIILFFVLITAGNLYAVVASPHIRELVQPDGSVVNARQWGDEWLHGWETVEGYSIVKGNAGFWVYADRDTTGRLFPTGIKAESPAPEGIRKFLRPRDGLAKRALGKRRGVAVQSVPTTGTAALPVILINYNDTETTNTSAEFESLLFGDTPAVATGPGSLKDYYEEISYKAFGISSGSSGVSGWHTAANGHDYYGQNDASGNDMHAAELVKEAVLAADAAGFDFSQCDNDGDGKVDVVVVVHQGTGEESTGVANDIWSHRWTFTSAGVGTVTVDGVTIDDYVIQPERGSDGIITIGVFAHEFGHALGLPDLYDTDKSSEGVGEWCLMASGNWTEITNAGDSPAHMSAWCKYFLGWITPTVVSGTLTDEPIDQTATAADVYQLLGGSPRSGEYFLVENRQKAGFDQGLPGNGLLIWHIDGTVIANNLIANSINTNECYPGGPDCTVNHYGVALEQADSLWDLEVGFNRGDEGDTYFGSNVYVADSNNYRIQKFNSDGNFITKWGSFGSGNGEFGIQSPRGVAVDSSGNVYVADSTNYRIQVFDSDGNFKTAWGYYGSGDGEFGSSLGVAADPSGNVSVADSNNYRIQKFDSDGNFITKWGSFGSGDGEFGVQSPSGVAADSSGNVYVADSTNYRIQVFDSDGNFVTKWGSFGSGDGEFGIQSPSGVAVENKSFAESSLPNSKLYSGDSSTVKVTDISASGSQMTAILHVDSDMVTTTTADSTTSTLTDDACPAEIIYGDHSEEIEFLRYFRDNVLRQTAEGQEITRLYYEWSPVIVKAMEEDEELKKELKTMINGVLGLVMEETK